MSAGEAKPRGLFSRIFGGGPDKRAVEEQSQAEPSTTSAAPETSEQDRDPPAATEQAGPRPTAAGVEDAPTGAGVPAATAIVAASAAPPPKKGWFQRLKDGLSKTSSKLSDGITGLFTKRKLDGATLDDLEDLLIQADLGVETAQRITEAISKGRYEKGISADEVRAILSSEVEKVLSPVAKPLVIDAAHKPHVVLVVGVNGTGKTTTIGKLAAQLAREGKSVMMAAGDTFRAAAIDQLKVWGERTKSKVIARDVGADSSGLAFDALKEAQAAGADVLLIDTAGRLQNKAALMDELEKVVRVIKKIDATAPHDVLLVLDATTGQNAMSQVEVFRERAGVTGLIMTKLDGTARGGILVAIAAKHGLPVHAIGIGEGIDDMQPFAAKDFAEAIAQS